MRACVMTNNIPRDPSRDQHIWLHKSDMDKQTIITRPIFYMVEPTYYDPRPDVRMDHNGYVENVFCKTSNPATFSLSVALDQAAKARELLVDLDASVILGKGRAGQLDGPFTRDAGLAFMEVTKENNGLIEHVKMRTITANYCHHKRHEQKETEDFMAAISFMYHRLNEDFNGSRITIGMEQAHLAKGDPCGEFGDFMYVPSKDILVAGYRPEWATDPEDGRTDRAFHDIVSKKFAFEGRVLPIEVANGYFHADTSTKWLPNGKVVAFEGGMTPQSFKNLQKAAGVDNIILTSKMDAECYACNLLVVDENNIIMAAEVSSKLVREIERTGIKVHTTPLSQFTKLSGGGLNCLTNRLNNVRNRDADYELPSFEA